MHFSDLLKRYNGGILDGAQKKLADALGTGIYNISHWNAGRSYPTEEIRPQIARILGCSEQELMDALNTSKAAHRAKLAGKTVESQPSGYKIIRQGLEFTPVLATISSSEFRIQDIVSLVPEEFLPIPQPDRGNQYIAFRIKGDKFKPMGSDGEFLLIAYTHFVEDNRPALIMAGNNYIVGTVKWLSDELAEITPIGAKSKQFRIEEVEIEGKIIATIRKPS